MVNLSCTLMSLPLSIVLSFFVVWYFVIRNCKLLTVVGSIALTMFTPTAISVLYNEQENNSYFCSETNLKPFSINQTLCDSNYVPHDLPTFSGIFVGREENLTQIINMMNTVHIVGVHGPPGFGKSLLSIHIGYEMINRGVTVRYIDVFDRFSHLKSLSTNLDSDYYSQSKQQSQSGSSQVMKHGEVSHYHIKEESIDRSNIIIRQLLIWSKSINCNTLLILDNCNEVLNDERTKEAFVQLVQTMIENSHGNLFIIITSRQKLLILDDFDSLVVNELSSSASVELLLYLAPNITKEDAKFIAHLIEGCPLALKVIGKLLHTHEDRITDLLKHELQKHPLRVLDKATLQRERFRAIMNSVFNHSSTFELRDCGYYISLMPGSFDFQAGREIIRNSVQCIQNLLEQSLLEEYHFANQTRYKMHRLIREYFKEMSNSSHYYSQFITHFKEQFCEYFTEYLLKFAIKHREQIVSEYDEFVYISEVHNVHYTLQLLLSKINDSELSTMELKVLAFAIGQELISTSTIISTQLVPILIGKLNDVCSMLSSDKCGEIFSLIIQRLYQECRCRTVKEYFKQVTDMRTPCMDIFQCHTVSEIYEHDIILSQLPQHEKAFLSRLKRLHCGTGYRIYHYLCPNFIGPEIICFVFYHSLYEILSEGKMGASDLAFYIFIMLYHLVHFVYYTGIERNDELMVWLTIYFPALVQILLRILLFLVSILFRVVCGNSLDRLLQQKYCVPFVMISLAMSYSEVVIFWNLVPYCY